MTEPTGEVPAFVSSGGLEKYGYCPLSWWLSRTGKEEESEALKAGQETHRVIGRDMRAVRQKERLSKESEYGILWFAVIAVMVALNGVAILYSIYAPPIQAELMTLALLLFAGLWMAVGVIFYLTGRARFMAETATHKPEEKRGFKGLPRETQVVVAIFLIGALLIGLNGFLISYSPTSGRTPEVVSTILFVLSLMWLLGTSVVLFFTLTMTGSIKEDKIVYASKPGLLSNYEWLILLFSLVASALAINAIALRSRPSTELGRIMLILAIVWIYGSFVFMYRALAKGILLRQVGRDLKTALFRMKRITKIDIASQGFFSGEKDLVEFERGTLWFSLVAGILAINAMLMFSFRQSDISSSGFLFTILSVVALVWLLGASIFFYVYIENSNIASRIRQTHGILEGKVAYADTLDDAPLLLSSEKLRLRGRPDLILRMEGHHIPYEIKAGRIPRGPLFSHILQLGSYCLLVEEHYGRPPYGVIRYAKGVEHRVEFDERLRETVMKKIAAMRLIASGRLEAHRNHNRPGKCRACSRRATCPERLE